MKPLFLELQPWQQSVLNADKVRVMHPHSTTSRKAAELFRSLIGESIGGGKSAIVTTKTAEQIEAQMTVHGWECTRKGDVISGRVYGAPWAVTVVTVPKP